MRISPSLSLAIVVSTAAALKVPVISRRGPETHYPVLAEQADGDVTYNFTRATNNGYTITLKVNEVPYQVRLDTGSSDTWVDVTAAGIMPPDVISTGVNSTTAYVDGSSSTGPVVLANVSFGPFTVHNQAMVISQRASAPSDATEFNGLLGLSKRGSATIVHSLMNTTYEDNAAPVLINLFTQEERGRSYFTFLLTRTEIGISDGGVFTISEVVEELASITSTPKYETISLSDWAILVGGVNVNGQLLTGNSIVASTYEKDGVQIPNNFTVATIDTGTSFMRGPKYYVDAFYKDVPGAIATDDADGFGGAGYQVPCDTKVNVTFIFGKDKYPIHPFDAIMLNATSDGTYRCFGALTATNASQQGLTSDWLLGDSFMRNVYSLYDYGNEVDKRSGSPFIQFLSLTNPDTAWEQADAWNRRRVSVYEAYGNSSYNVQQPASTQLVYTGAIASIPVTAVDNRKQTTFTQSAHTTFSPDAAPTTQ